MSALKYILLELKKIKYDEKINVLHTADKYIKQIAI